MRRLLFPFIGSLLFLAGGSLPGADGWTQLRLGMSGDEAAETLGHPLIKTSGGGFELWVYDNHAEVVFYGGPLVGWTSPKKDGFPVQTVDVWQAKADSNAPRFILPRSWSPPNRAMRRNSDGAAINDSMPAYRLRN